MTVIIPDFKTVKLNKKNELCNNLCAFYFNEK